MKSPPTFLLDGAEMPGPNMVVGKYRLHLKTERVPERRFRTPDGVEAFTVQLSNLFGRDRQATILAVPQETGASN